MWGSAKELFGASFRRWYKGGGAESALAALLFVASDIPIVWILLLCLSVFLYLRALTTVFHEVAAELYRQAVRIRELTNQIEAERQKAASLGEQPRSNQNDPRTVTDVSQSPDGQITSVKSCADAISDGEVVQRESLTLNQPPENPSQPANGAPTESQTSVLLIRRRVVRVATAMCVAAAALTLVIFVYRYGGVILAIVGFVVVVTLFILGLGGFVAAMSLTAYALGIVVVALWPILSGIGVTLYEWNSLRWWAFLATLFGAAVQVIWWQNSAFARRQTGRIVDFVVEVAPELFGMLK